MAPHFQGNPNTSPSIPDAPPVCFDIAPVPGDADGNGYMDISDVLFIEQYIFAGGDPPIPLEAGDSNCDSIVDISDYVYLIAYIFLGGPEPC